MMAETFRIRRASVTDIDALVEFNIAMARETEDKTLDDETLRAGVVAVLAQPARGFYLVAADAEKVIGCLMITYEWSDWRNGDWWWLQSVYVAQAQRRRGVFRALHAAIEQHARATAGVVGLRLYVERDNTRAQATYASLGMHAAHYSMWEREFADAGQG
jgi:GNAT superfamily N-acetyltransferase